LIHKLEVEEWGFLASHYTLTTDYWLQLRGCEF